ncbi:hypothetical protein PSI9734_02367 [Pseudidiomarina piscicola]|uniref:Uncharacterized protein n=1 Tax=Pseudidiomarina piscicola TaxID=2614830 RepID=A0A6S6WSR6_9GAMM|nr:hypothetical protein [Pseudidiomarina piscicola]CAB0152019.1 hypothetical protein PSI9734_02367 [Pseudidiomarina piscicola]VZT41460.1 hypothetical protein PSI9734_02367 [Pseudomonas aeruginosa]
MTKQNGQAIIESIAVIMLLAVLLTLIKDVIEPTNSAQQRRIDNSRALMMQVLPEDALAQSDDYAFAERAKVVLAPLKLLSELDLSHDNLRILSESDNYVAMAQIQDAWQPAHTEDLDQRPANLTPFAQLDKLGIANLQRLVSWLHFSEEFAPDELRWGWSNNEATPTAVLCRQSNSC